VENIEQPSAWDLRLDLVSSRALLWVATASGTGKVRREVHQYLVIVTNASLFTIMPADTREGPRTYGPRHVGIFASAVVAILVLPSGSSACNAHPGAANLYASDRFRRAARGFRRCGVETSI
jgi:hypothetical protein